jgi:hypothetical protein
MDLDIDGGVLLYVLGIGFALAALAYFVRDVVFALSITVKAALLFVAFLGFLLGGIAMDRDVLDRVSLVLAGAAYVVFVVYVVTRYGLDATAIFLVLAASAVLFVGLGYGLRQYRPAISPRTATVLAVALVAVAVLLVGADVATAGVTYETEFDESVTVTAPADAPPERPVVQGEATIGSITVTNEGPFTRSLDMPRMEGCVVGVDAGSETRTYVQYDPRTYDRPDYVSGGTSQNFDLVTRLPIPNETEQLTYAIERGTDCDVDRDEPTLIVDDEASPR